MLSTALGEHLSLWVSTVPESPGQKGSHQTKYLELTLLLPFDVLLVSPIGQTQCEASGQDILVAAHKVQAMRKR